MTRFIAVSLLTVLALSFGLSACSSKADKVSTNLSKEAENFNVVRQIVVINDITDKVEFEVTGRCSVEGDGLGSLRALTAICKDSDGPGSKATFKKHFLGLANQTEFVVVQKQGINVSEYRTKIILKPQNLVPDVDLVTGD